MILSDASIVAHNYAKNHHCILRTLRLDHHQRVVFMNVPINGNYMYRCSLAGWRKADISRDGSLIIVYHSLVESDKVKGAMTMPLDQYRDACKFIAHVPRMKKALADPDYKPLPYKLTHDVKPSNSREIVIATMHNLTPIYESGVNDKVQFNYLELEDGKVG